MKQQQTKWVVKERGAHKIGSYAYDSLEEALRDLSNRRAIAIKQGGHVGLLTRNRNPKFVIGLRADYLGRRYEAWIEVEEVMEQV